MKLQILQEDLSRYLSISSRFTSTRAQLPVLGNVLLKAGSNKLFLSATNLENSIYISLGAKVEEEGEITVPIRVISDIIGNLNPGPVVLTSEKEILNVTSGSFSSSMTGVNASDFPDIPKKIGSDAITISQGDFLESLNKVLFSVSSDETRPILTGVLMQLKKTETLIVSTDGFRLSQTKIAKQDNKKEGEYIIPKGILNELVRLGATDEQLQMSFGENQVVFKVDSTILSSRVIEGEFPDFERIIPKTSDVKVTVGKTDLAQAIKLASVFARDSANVVKIAIEKAGVAISAESQMHGNQKNKIEAKVEADGSNKSILEIAYNYRFLEELLQVVKSEDVEIGLTDANAPGIFKDLEDKTFLHLIMPVKLQG